MTRALTAFFVLILLAGPASIVRADDPTATASNEQGDRDPVALLSEAAQAVRQTTYRGTIVYVKDGNVDTLQVVHRFNDGVEQERLISQSGEAREIIRNGDEVTSILPEHEVVLISEHPRKTLLGSVAHFSPEQLRKYYDAEIQKDTVRFAGRRCRVIAIKPADEFRYGYRMYVDTQTDLPLKLALRYQGKRLEQLMFTDVSFPESLPDEAFVTSYDLGGFKVIRHQSVQVDRQATPDDEQQQWTFGELPPGFRLAEDGVRQVTPEASVRQLLFTDGVATVSAFIAPAGLRAPLEGSTRMGAVNAYGNIVGNSQITVVGEVPAITARQIGENIVDATRLSGADQRAAEN